MAIRPLSEALQKKAEEEVKEIPDRIKNSINTIKEWITKQPHLKARTDDQWILSFLRGCKFSLERTKEKIDSYYTVRNLIPEFFKNRDPFEKEVQDILRQGVILPLPKTVNDTGPRIILMRWSTCDPNVNLLVTMGKIYFMILDILLNEDDNCAIVGQEAMIDHVDLKTAYVLQFTPSLLKKISICVKDSFPVRIKGIYVFNSFRIFETVFSFFKMLMPEKLRNRMFLYSGNNLENLYTHVPVSLLPKDYGGSNSSIEELTAVWKKKVESYREWFLEDEKFEVNEHLRIEKSRSAYDTFGIEGSFRKLDID